VSTPEEAAVTDDQCSTPYLDALLRHKARAFVAFSTPGHKHGKGAPAGMVEAFGRTFLEADVPMAGGVEDSRESTDLLHAAEDLAAQAWGAERCFFLVNGSTGGVQSLVITLAGPGDTLIVPRNAHKSLLAGLIFSGAMPHYVEPAIDPEWGVPQNITVAAAVEALRACPGARAFFVTSPTYNGFGADLRALATLVHAAGMPYVVDQAWGPHLRFCSRLPIDAMSAGADAAVTSTHKLISGLTQSSVLLANGDRLNLKRLQGAVKMTQSTSPQAIIYASIDACRMQMATEGEELWTRAVELAEWAREQTNRIEGLRCLGHECLERDGIASFDPTRLTITACALGDTGWQLETALRDGYGIAVEAADTLNVVLNVTHGDSREDLERLVAALKDYAARRDATASEAGAACLSLMANPPRFTRQELSPHDAFFARSVALPLAGCVGRVSAEIITPYPPGIPVLGPGELVSDECVAYLTEAGARGLHVHGPEDLSLRTLRVVG
jgi:arginine decarboxylase